MERSGHHHHQYVGGQGKKGQGRSTSSISELFGDRDSPAASAGRSGVFQSVFSTSSSSSSQWSSAKGGGSSHFESSSRSKYGSGETKNQKFEQLEEVEPFFLSSSLYYGGQDMCVRAPTSHASGTSNIFPKNGGEDDPNSNSNGASRGNWWQGSLYY
ncbi:hypothetical protein EJ110_NYTH08981 [Nymphaea thermarum]|nr:uncharacterized protein LOC116264596 [Nymphaea colorata]XP_031500768.1 uncharacterized protein LOC116264596 [Nymphaea colorata]KAF3790269.1 hypothetical protein EJ110_NYTH08981 [Nymphaea thermarum]